MGVCRYLHYPVLLNLLPQEKDYVLLNNNPITMLMKFEKNINRIFFMHQSKKSKRTKLSL